jgi:ankyrin repeat protein
MLHLDLRQGKDLVRASCGRLLELLEDETVSVIHHSFTEFLHDKSRTSTQGAFPVLDEVASHAMLAVLSLEYLDGCSHILGTTDKIQKLRNGVGHSYDGLQQIRERMTKLRIMYPFMSYAADNNTFHLSRAAAGPVGRVKEALTRYVLPGKPAWEAWRLTHPQWMEEINTMLTVFHMAAVSRGGIAMPLFVAECFEEADPTHLDSRDSYGRTPLSYAAHHGNVHLTKFLLDKGADPESADQEYGQMPLHWATLSGQFEIVRLLLEAGVDPLIKTCPVLEKVSSFDSNLESWTPEEAEEQRTTALSSVRHAEVLEVFMPFVPTTEFNLLFHRAHSHVQMVRMILDTGNVDVDCFWRGTTKLFRAAALRDLDLIKLLLDHGADPNKRCCGDGSQCSCRDDVTMRIADTGTERGPTPLHALAGFSDGYIRSWPGPELIPECIQVLIKAGACVNATAEGPDSDGANLTPLHYAVQENNRRDIWGGTSSFESKESIATPRRLKETRLPILRVQRIPICWTRS